MLIKCDRHRSSDLEVWDEHYAADLVHGHRPVVASRVRRSLNAIVDFLFAGPAYVGVSWGKESVITAHLVRHVDPSIPLINLRCSNRNPYCDSVREAYLARFPSIYEEVVVDYSDLHARNLPDDDLDRLTDRAWYASIESSGSRFSHRHILGLRAGESAGRHARCARWGENSPNGSAPLAWWKIADVFGYLAVHDLPIHPSYAMLGAGRWSREFIRVAEVGDTHGTAGGRGEWEQEYYGDIINQLRTRKKSSAQPNIH